MSSAVTHMPREYAFSFTSRTPSKKREGIHGGTLVQENVYRTGDLLCDVLR